MEAAGLEETEEWWDGFPLGLCRVCGTIYASV